MVYGLTEEEIAIAGAASALTGAPFVKPYQHCRDAAWEEAATLKYKICLRIRQMCVNWPQQVLIEDKAI